MPWARKTAGSLLLISLLSACASPGLYRKNATLDTTAIDQNMRWVALDRAAGSVTWAQGSMGNTAIEVMRDVRLSKDGGDDDSILSFFGKGASSSGSAGDVRERDDETIKAVFRRRLLQNRVSVVEDSAKADTVLQITPAVYGGALYKKNYLLASQKTRKVTALVEVVLKQGNKFTASQQLKGESTANALTVLFFIGPFQWEK